MLVVHDLEKSRSQRILWLAEELGLDYQLVLHPRDPQTMRSPKSIWALSPMGKAPVIEDDGEAIAESGAIVEYILEKYGKGALQPARNSADYRAYRHWLHASESTLMFPVLIDTLMGFTQTRSEMLGGFVAGEMQTVFGYLESELAKHPFVAGNSFSAADIMVWFTMHMAFSPILPGLESRARAADYPSTSRWMQRLAERPAFQKAMSLSQGR